MWKTVLGGLVALLVLAALTTAVPAPAGEVAYPTRQLTYLVVWDPGGQSDVEARRQQPYLEKALGQKVNITYKPGGAGAVGWADMVRARPDGYQITGINVPQISILPMLQDVGFKTEQILTFNMFHWTPHFLAGRKDAPYKTMKELVEYAKANPGKVKFASTGTNSLGHVAAMLIRKLAGISFEYVPFTGTAPMMTALLGGHIDVAITVSSDAVTYMDRTAALGIATAKRSEILPNIPTLREQGVDLTTGSYRGVAVPTGTPDPIVQKLEKVFLDICKTPEYVEIQKKGGYEPIAMGVEESKAEIAKQAELFRAMFAEMGILKK
jgi:tripartite-type tricarboxylate transporter receptor subunit TctC